MLVRPHLIASLMLLLAAVAVRAEDAPATQPTTQPAAIQASDTDTITAKKGEIVTVEGVVERAEWSKSGKVLNLYFKEANKDADVMASAFSKNREKLDAAFEGDAAAHWTGAKIRITAKIEPYGGKVESMKNRLQMVIQNPEQVVIVEPAPKP